MRAANARQVLLQSDAVLLDFDGPICSVFAGLPASDIARALRTDLPSSILLPAEIEQTEDPLEVVRWLGSNARQGEIEVAQHALIARELLAVRTAAPTLGSQELIQALAIKGHPLAVVSNNSTEAVCAYLARQNLERHFQVIVGRPPDASLMKPHPFMLHLAAQRLGVPVEGCVLVGDSLTDIEAAKRAGARCVALANKPSKFNAFRDAKPDAVVASMLELGL